MPLGDTLSRIVVREIVTEECELVIDFTARPTRRLTGTAARTAPANSTATGRAVLDEVISTLPKYVMG